MKFNQIIGDRRTGRTSTLVDQGVYSVLAGKNVLVIASTQNEVSLIVRNIAEKLKYLAKDTPNFDVIVQGGSAYVSVPTPEFYNLYNIRVPTPGIVWGTSFSPLQDYWNQLRGKKVDVVLIDNADYLGTLERKEEDQGKFEVIRDLMFAICTRTSPERVWTVSERPLDLSSGL